ncbi:MAG TPA: carboxyl transferase domain-containing protein [Candidatus Sumerlaeota bacterium]|nr:carboxyl transferase domain-containing protein [Candidatus Sumerlaeota bacterium]HPK03610.1 carboxyl transferase domain-containing protein [Candidatus Sumerlaeota bacterium]
MSPDTLVSDKKQAEARQPAKPLETTAAKLKDLTARRKQISLGGGEAALKKRKESGRLNARERLDLLLDPSSFQEMYQHRKHRCTNFGMERKDLAADGVVTGLGAIDGRPVCIASQDFTVAGGSLGEAHGQKIVEMMKMSLKCGSPFIMINDSGGARIQEAVDGLNSYGEIFYHNVLASGVVPQISLICGPCAGGAAYSPALTDFIIMVRGNKMFITGPEVVKSVTGEEISAEQLGGADTQATVTGNIHFIADSDEQAFAICRKLLSFLPSNNLQDPPSRNTGEVDLTEIPALDKLMPDSAREAYDVREVIRLVIDGGDFLEVMEHWATNIVIGFARIDGNVVGIIANQPLVMAGVLDINASDKASRFIRFCNAFNIPIVSFVDVPGYMPGVNQEHGGIIRHGAKLLFAYSATTTPKITVILRKAYGGAYLAMCSKSLGADRTGAWPTGEIAVMGAEGAVPIIFRREMEQAEDKEARRQELLDEYRVKFGNPYLAASRGLIDDVIQPRETRRYIAMSLRALQSKRDLRPPKKHGLMPL